MQFLIHNIDMFTEHDTRWFKDGNGDMFRNAMQTYIFSN